MTENQGYAEPFLPDVRRGDLIEAEHLARYWWAAQLADGRAVLDAGCGVGYGASIMVMAHARSYVGVDVDAATISHARDHFSLEQATFSTADITELSFDDGAFDLIVCFEVIEHVADPKTALAELSRVLSDEGVLVISTPNSTVYRRGNPFHVREFTHTEFPTLLRAQIRHVELYHQHNWVASAIFSPDLMKSADASQPHDLRARKVASVRPGGGLYTLAVCSNAQPPVMRPEVMITHGLEVKRWLEQIDRTSALSADVAAKAADVDRLQSQLTQKEQVLQDVRGDLLETRRRTTRKLASLQSQAAEWHAVATSAQAHLDLIVATKTWRYTKPARVLASWLRAVARKVLSRRIHA